MVSLDSPQIPKKTDAYNIVDVNGGGGGICDWIKIKKTYVAEFMGEKINLKIKLDLELKEIILCSLND